MHLSLFGNLKAMPKNYYTLSCPCLSRLLIVNPQRDRSSLWLGECGKEFDMFSKSFSGQAEREGDYRNSLTQVTGDNEDNEDCSNTLAPGQTLYGTGFKLLSDFRSLVPQTMGDSRLLQSFDDYSGSHPTLPELNLTTEDVTRYKMAWRAFESGEVQEGFLAQFGLTQRCKDWPNIEDIIELRIALGFITATSIYGGLHALAWFAHFDSSIEQLLWRISACVVMGGMPILVALLKAKYNNIDLSRYSRYTVLHYASLIVLLAYVLARGYLVVECFINLSHLPAGVYDVPQWAAYFPHIS